MALHRSIFVNPIGRKTVNIQGKDPDPDGPEP